MVNSGVDHHRDDYATFGVVIVIIQDCPGYGLTVVGDNGAEPLPAGNIVVLDSKSLHYVPLGKREKDRIVLSITI